MRGVIPLKALNEQMAREVAFGMYKTEGIEWKYVEEDEEYDVQIVEVDLV